MGDLIGEIVSGTLYRVTRAEMARLLGKGLQTNNKIELFASINRINALYMIARAGSGHIGSSFSSMEIMSYLYAKEVYPDCSVERQDVSANAKALFFSSKGHDAPALYSVLIALGVLEEKLLGKLRQLDGLPGHPDIKTPGIVTNTGSLGMGVSKAKGFICANRLNKRHQPVFVLTGDGELQEGQFWESLISASNRNMDELTIIIDHNKLQSDTLVRKVSDLGNLGEKLAAFGLHVERCDGNDVAAFASCINRCKSISGKPKAIIADTVKGKGVSFMEHTSFDSDVENYKFHSGAPSAKNYARAVNELVEKANKQIKELGISPLRLETVQAESVPSAAEPTQRLIPAYSNSLLKLAEQRDEIVVLDADLILDTGLIPFSERFSSRFIECGIAEQDMVSQAGALALKGFLPIAHSFASFLSARPREQIYNNSSEQTKIVYVGSLAGVLPAGPGHSHQAVSDIASLGHIPSLSVLVPGCEDDVGPLLEWAVNSNEQSTYLRLESLPVTLALKHSKGHQIRYGFGYSVNEVSDVKIVTYGPTMISVALKASFLIFEKTKRRVEVINFPWVNAVSDEWIKEINSNCRILFCLENHFVTGALGDSIARSMTVLDHCNFRFEAFGVEQIPCCGRNEEVLQNIRLDPDFLASNISAKIASLN